MTERIFGIHHVTAITGDGQKNIDFYCGVLGLRLVKVTVNFDDPQSYHLYYGDELGAPGSIMTFFVWPGAHRGRQGTSQVTATAFSIPMPSFGFWRKRLADAGCNPSALATRIGSSVVEFNDPDGIRLELIARDAGDPRIPWAGGPIPEDRSIRGFFGVTLSEDGYEHTARMLSDLMGFVKVGEEGHRFRFIGSGAGGEVVDVLCTPGGVSGSLGAGVVHHVAFRAENDESQRRWREILAKAGRNVTPVIDRTYFHSIYFREPGGVLFEIATDNPGFTVDEPASSLGTSLKLPLQFEKDRTAIKSMLPQLRLPGGATE
ncbi:MAG: ring-cleaving dioxygenase [Planctomycetes bacterium]|nr:ring-cleaving dioxygenase [Planctomycetota bacterium]